MPPQSRSAETLRMDGDVAGPLDRRAWAVPLEFAPSRSTGGHDRPRERGGLAGQRRQASKADSPSEETTTLVRDRSNPAGPKRFVKMASPVAASRPLNTSSKTRNSRAEYTARAMACSEVSGERRHPTAERTRRCF